MRVWILAALVLAGVGASACNGPVDPSENSTETFNGTMVPKDARVHTFNVGKNGEYFVAFKSLTPPLAQSTFPTGIRVTKVVSGQCVFGAQIVGDNQNATPGHQALNGLIEPGQFCLWIYDLGFFTTDESYVIDVSHP